MLIGSETRATISEVGPGVLITFSRSTSYPADLSSRSM